MKPERWSRVRELYERAIEIPPERRTLFLEESTGDDAELRAEVEQLLSSDPGGDTFLRPPAQGRIARSLERGSIELREGAVLGGYRIVRSLGTGGMGAVYEAVQERPERTVALKVLRDPLAGEDARRRFQVEAEVLGRLRHAGIATVYEMGEEVLDGRSVPFFALELVPGGRDLVTHARELPLRGRIELFREVCAAVHHAHLSGVLHRDLKPANLLVDEHGRPKVIDYGVARAMDPAAVPAGLETRGEQIVGTLQYMAPEQLRGGSEGIDARADVYALGLVLYELLAGTRPYELTGMPLAGVVATVCEGALAPPSTHAAVPRELDWIALCAAEKDPERRYESAAELARDLGRFLANEPVIAAPPGVGYRLRKFAARNRITVIAGVTTFLGLTAAVVVTSLASVEARDQRDVAGRALADLGLETAEKQRALEDLEQETLRKQRALEDLGRANEDVQKALSRQVAVTDALMDILSAVHPDEDGYEVTLFSLLERTRPRFEERRVDPHQRAVLSDVFARAYQNLSLPGPASELYESALAALQETGAGDPQLEASVKLRLAKLRCHEMRIGEAEELADEVDALFEELDDVPPENRLLLERVWGMIAEVQGNFIEAERVYRAGLQRYADELPEGDADVLEMRSRHGHTLLETGRFTEARQVLEAAYEEAQAQFGEDHWTTLGVGSRLAQTLQAVGENERAIQLGRSVATGLGALYGEHSQAFLNGLIAQQVAELGAGRASEAADTSERALAVLAEHHPQDAELETALCANYGVALAMLGRHEESLEQLERAEVLLEAHGQHDTKRMYDVQQNVAENLMNLGDLEAAEERVLRMRAIGVDIFGPDSWQVHFAESRLAAVYAYGDRTEEAVALFREARAAMRASVDELAQMRADQTERSVGGFARRAGDLGQTESQALLLGLLDEWGIE